MIVTPASSFIRFDGENIVSHCIHGEFKACLPVYAEADISFQFVVQADTIEEADALCLPGESGIQIGIVRDCEQEGFDVEFDELPERYRISDLQVLYNWPHGVPGMIGEIDAEECFYIRVVVDNVNYCTNCFRRIPDDCFSSVIEYGNDENFGGFNYCNGEGVDEATLTCSPEIITFTNKETLTIPYTAALQAKFGTVPTVQVWIYIDGVLTNVGVVASFDNMPPSFVNIDFGGTSSGVVILR